MKFCVNCGARLNDGAKFCTECGQKIPQAEPVAPPTPVYEAPAPVVQPEPVYVAPVVQPEPVYEAPAPVVQPEPVYEAPAPAANTFFEPNQTEPRQSVTHTYGAPVQHSFSAPVETETAKSGVYSIPAAEPVAAAPEKSRGAAMFAKSEKSAKAEKATVGETAEKAAAAAKNLGAKARTMAGKADLKGLAGNKFVRIGLVAVLVLILAISLFSCIGGKDDPNAGVYHVVSCTYDGIEVGYDDDWIELKKNGKAEIQLMGAGYNGKWELDDEEFTLDQGGDEYYGTLEENVLTLDFGGLIYTFEREATEEKKADKAPDKSTEKSPEKEEIAEEVGYWTLHHLESDDPDSAMDAETVQMMKAFGMEIYLDLKEDGTGVIFLDEPFDITWGKGKAAFDDNSTFTYELKDDQLIADVEGEVLVFVRGEAGEAPAVGADVAEDREELTDPMLKFWEGDWYGWWVMWSADGEYESMEDDGWDAYATIDVSSDYTGTVTLWDVDSSWDEPIAVVDVSFRQGLGEEGCMVSESGWFYDCEVAHADWNIDPPASMVRMFDNMIAIDSYYVNPENSDNTYNYVFILRPWGMDWEDVRGVEAEGTYYEDMMPFEYESWYLPLIEQGEDLPESHEAGEDLIG